MTVLNQAKQKDFFILFNLCVFYNFYPSFDLEVVFPYLILAIVITVSLDKKFAPKLVPVYGKYALFFNLWLLLKMICKFNTELLNPEHHHIVIGINT